MDVNALEDEDQTALHHAALYGYLDVAKQLVLAKINLFVKNGLEQTARDIAIKHEHAKVSTFLRHAEQEAQEKAKQPSRLTPLPSNSPVTLAIIPMSPHTPETLQIMHGDIQYGIKIGEGGFGVVYQGKWQRIDVAIKRLYLNVMTKEVDEEFQKETQIMAQLRHLNVVQLYGVCIEPNHYAMVMELMPKGSLYHVLHSGQTLPWSIRYNIAMDVGAGLTYLHHQDILHRDLKSLNVLLDGNFRAKLTDFGLAKVKVETKTKTAHKPSGTTRWMAPETVNGKSYTEKTDVYGFALILWELASRKILYEQAGEEMLVLMWIMQGTQETIPADCPKEFGEAIMQCWQLEPTIRPKMKEAMTYLESLSRLSIFRQEPSDDNAGPATPKQKVVKPSVIDRSFGSFGQLGRG